jgi:hypothetical protein
VKQYIGTKIIQAEKQLHDGKDGYKVLYPDGYISWSPKDVFEKAYRQTDGMNFGLALETLKMHERVARAGWNGKGMWLRIVIPGGDNKSFDMGMENLPYLEMKTANNKLVPWLASQTDMLAEDWRIVD